MKHFDSSILLSATRHAVNCFAGKRFQGFFTPYELEETVSDTVLKLLKAGTYDPEKGDFRSWIRTSAERAVLSAAMKKAAYNRIFSSFNDLSPVTDEDWEEYPDDMPELGLGSEMPDDILIEKETRENIYGSLGERARRILDLRLQGFGSGEIAGKLGISTGAAYMAVHHIRESVRKVA